MTNTLLTVALGGVTNTLLTGATVERKYIVDSSYSGETNKLMTGTSGVTNARLTGAIVE